MANSFEELLQQVEQIDRIAALWLRENRNTFGTQTWKLSAIMTWATTPQGHDYWWNIHKKITNSEPDKTQKIHNRIKKLWNNSNYVRKHNAMLML